MAAIRPPLRVAYQAGQGNQGVHLHTWHLQTEDVHLFSIQNQLHYEVVYQNGRVIGPILIETPPDRSLQECIDNLVRLEPTVSPDGSVLFMSRQEDSQLDPEVQLTDDQWAVTLVDAWASRIRNKDSWGGHACLVIEGIKDGRYFMKMADLVSGSGKGIGKARLIDNPSLEVSGQSETWSIPKPDGERMLGEVQREIALYNQGNPQVHFDPRGSESILVHAPSFFEQPHNCFSWARKTLSRARIHLYIERNILKPTFMEVPKFRISQNSIHCKQEVTVLCLGGVGKQTVDVTKEVQRALKARSWKPILFEMPWDEYGTLTKVAAVANITWSIPLDGGDAYQIPYTEISVQVRGEGIRRIDVTQVIKGHFAEENEREKSRFSTALAKVQIHQPELLVTGRPPDEGCTIS